MPKGRDPYCYKADRGFPPDRDSCGTAALGGEVFSDHGDHLSCAAQTGVLDEPAVGLAGWKFAAPQIVIVSDRRSRESNDPNRRSPLHPLPLPPSSQIGVDLRGVHPKPSQIGVHFSDRKPFGVEFRPFSVFLRVLMQLRVSGFRSRAMTAIPAIYTPPPIGQLGF